MDILTMVAVAVGRSYGIRAANQSDLRDKIGNHLYASHPAVLAANAKTINDALAAAELAAREHELTAVLGRSEADRAIAAGRATRLREAIAAAADAARPAPRPSAEA